MNKMPRVLAGFALMAALPVAALAQVAPQGPPPPPDKDVVVEGKRAPPPPCKPTDQACIKVVVTALWERYPKQMEIFCTNENIRSMRNMNLAAQLGYDSSQLAGSDLDDHQPSARQAMCPRHPPKPKAP